MLLGSFPCRFAFSYNSDFSSFTIRLFSSYITSLPIHTFTNFTVLLVLFILTENHELIAVARLALSCTERFFDSGSARICFLIDLISLCRAFTLSLAFTVSAFSWRSWSCAGRNVYEVGVWIIWGSGSASDSAIVEDIERYEIPELLFQ